MRKISTSACLSYAKLCDSYGFYEQADFYENLAPVWDEWEGYGSWDWYTLLVTEKYKQLGGDFQQYVLKGKTIFEYSIGPLKEGFGNYYKKYLSLKDIPDQKEKFKNKVFEYASTRLNQLLK